MLYDGLEDRVGPDQWAIWKDLVDEQSAACIFDQPDYYTFVTYSLFRGQKPGGPALQKHR